ncbi:enoyl-CoA hydratase/isomerase family protein [Marivita sp. S2033]|uniref:enoyl-CoA hydratase/isomerase family protein n=1 Tax=Marivita sp. S2033 TaxID=3373187 RepID=UPI003981BAAE
MTGLVTTSQGDDGLFRLTLCAPRSNALEPRVLTELDRGLDALAASGCERAILAGGRNFSSGGDVERFHQAATENRAEAYAAEVVPVLQRCVLRMVQMPVLFAVAARGAITGGSAGLLFASDLAVLAPDVFVQPYYTRVGFAPDGGWAALLPERLGVGAAQDWLLSDRRVGADDLCRIGLAREVHASPEERAADILSGMNVASALAIKRLVWDDDRVHALRRRLSAETDAFRALIGQPATRAGMARFLGKALDAADV